MHHLLERREMLKTRFIHHMRTAHDFEQFPLFRRKTEPFARADRPNSSVFLSSFESVDHIPIKFRRGDLLQVVAKMLMSPMPLFEEGSLRNLRGDPESNLEPNHLQPSSGSANGAKPNEPRKQDHKSDTPSQILSHFYTATQAKPRKVPETKQRVLFLFLLVDVSPPLGCKIHNEQIDIGHVKNFGNKFK